MAKTVAEIEAEDTIISEENNRFALRASRYASSHTSQGMMRVGLFIPTPDGLSKRAIQQKMRRAWGETEFWKTEKFVNKALAGIRRKRH